jgi:alkanesulfonate monooxygenase SsuD/methylene tetrahydromethanopterin reductase-like flavin-dependent oxidoreductase (luciferase family)
MTVLTLRYDLRRPPFGAASTAELYAACLDQCAWADERGFTTVVVSEHHGVDDGYLPSPLVLAGAVAGRTRRIGITVSALLVPLHDPLRLAEDMAVLDLASQGRVSYVAGLGYREGEFEMFGVDRSRRGRLLEEHVAVLRQAWTGEPFPHRGVTVRVTPVPMTRPHPLLLIGGSTDKAARRAARLRLPFMPAIGDPALQAVYEEECRAVGYDGGFTILPSGPGFVHVTDDPERDWARIAPHARHEATTYASWQPQGQRSSVTVAGAGEGDVDSLRRSGVYAVVTPDECVELARSLGHLVFHPLMGGLAPELGWQSLELFDAKVRPRLSQ